MSGGKRILVFVAASCAIDLGFHYALALAACVPSLVIPSLALGWEIRTAFLGFFADLPALLLFSFVASFGGAAGKTEELIRASALPAALLAVVGASAIILLGPGMREKLATIESESRRFNSALDATRLALVAGQAASARESWLVLEAIDPDDARVLQLAEETEGAALRAGRAAKAPGVAEGAPATKLGEALSAREAYLKALSFFQKADWYSAHWYAKEAERLDPSLAEAPRLAARAWEEIGKEGTAVTEADRDRAAFHAAKSRAYELLRAGDYVGAFAAFSGLAAKDRDDVDVRLYLEESRVKLGGVAFFRQEFEEAAAREAMDRFLVLLPAKDGSFRALAARQAAFGPGAAWFADLEYLEKAAGSSSPSRLVSAPFAKLASGRLFLTAVNRDRPEELWRGSDRASAGGRLGSLELDLEPEEARAAARSRLEPAVLSVGELVETLPVLERFGLDEEGIIGELMLRLGHPFGLLAAAILGALIGIRFRASERLSTRRLPLLVLPFLALFSWAITDFAGRVDLLASAWARRLAEGPAALAVSVGLRLAFLAAAVLLSASLSRNLDEDGAD